MGPKGRALNYTDAEIEYLLDLAEEIKPLGAERWERVGERFRSHFSLSAFPRDTDSLKAKFKTLRLVKKPTGHPDCPPFVKRAKRIYREIESSADVIGADSESEGDEDNEEEADADFRMHTQLPSSTSSVPIISSAETRSNIECGISKFKFQSC